MARVRTTPQIDPTVGISLDVDHYESSYICMDVEGQPENFVFV